MKKLRSALALLLVLVMCLSLFPASAYAEDEIAEDEIALAGDDAPSVPEDGPATLSEYLEEQAPVPFEKDEPAIFAQAGEGSGQLTAAPVEGMSGETESTDQAGGENPNAPEEAIREDADDEEIIYLNGETADSVSVSDDPSFAGTATGAQLAEYALAQVGTPSSAYWNDPNWLSGNWCAWLVTWCADKLGLAGTASDITGNLFPPIDRNTWERTDPHWAATNEVYQANWLTKYNKGTMYYFDIGNECAVNGNWVQASRSSFVPKAGDILYCNGWGHVGIVTGFDSSSGYVSMVAGNESGVDGNWWRTSKVNHDSYYKTNTYINAYFRPKYVNAEIRASYPCDLTVETAVNNCSFSSLPGNSETYPGSRVVGKMTQAGQTFHATRIIENKVPGHYWYETTFPLTGETCYVWVNNTRNPSQNWSVSASGVSKPGNLTLGQTFDVRGVVSTGGAKITRLQGYIYPGNSTSGTPNQTSNAVSPNSTSYDLRGIDLSLYFNNVSPAGYYTYTVKVNLSSYTMQNGSPAEQTRSNVVVSDVTTYYRVGAPTTTYTVTLNPNGGSCSTGSLSYNAGDTLGSLPEPTAPNTLAPYRFDGWYTAASGGTKVSSSTTVNSSMTLYAHWIHDPFYSKITFVLNGGSFALLNGEGATTYTVKDYETGQQNSYSCYAAYLADNKYIYTAGMGDYYHELPVPTRSGYYFAGWYTDSGLSNYRTRWGTGYGGWTLYARWVDASSAYATASTTENGHVYEVFDYNMSWTAAKAFCEARGGHLVSITSAEEQNTVVSLITGSGDVNGSLNGQYYIGATDEETDTIWKWVTGEAFSFDKWDPDAPEPNGGASETYATIISVQNPPNKQTGEWVDVPNLHFGDYYSVSNTGFVCEYDNREYTVSYNANGGTGAPAPQIKTHNVTLTLSSVTPTRANSSAGSYTVTLNANGGSVSPASLTAARTTSYSFRNWNTAANGSGTSYSPGASYTANADATLYAQWNSSTATASVTLPTPTREGYIFRGWATSASAASGTTGSYTPSGNVTLYAIWEEAVAYGVWGELNWVIDSGGTLTISGNGPMDNNAYLGSDNWTDHKTKFSKVVIEEGVTSVGNFAFTMGTNVRQVTLPDSLTRIGTTAFALCKNLTEIVIPPHVTSIGDAALGGSGLTQITIPASVTSIGEQALTISSLTSVAFEGHAPTIGKDCFRNVEATVYFPANDASWTQSARQDYGGTLSWVIRTADGHSYGEPSWSWTEGYGAASASFRCLENNSTQTLTASVTSARVEATQSTPAKLVYTARVVFLQAEYTDTKEVLLGYNTTLTLPSSTVRIESEAFAGLTQGVNVVIPDSVQFIAADAFRKNRVVIIAEAGSYAAWWAEYNSVPCIIDG